LAVVLRGKEMLMKTAAVVPAFNEEITIGPVIEVLKQTKSIGEIIVVSDGSTDRTARIARQKGVTVVDLKNNIGKGGAMKRGVDKTSSDIVVFLDADLVGLTRRHVEDLARPVITGGADMSIGLFDGGRVATDIAQVLMPFLSGQRAVSRKILDELSDMDVARFGVEVALTRYVREKGYRVEQVPLAGLTHRMKEEKLGFGKGFLARLRMYWEIVKNVQKG
jgi:polyisoprenyl-phosphate glycosyltransferase